MSSTHDASSVMHVHPNVAICNQPRFTGMQTDTHPDRDTAGPGMLCQGPLYGGGSRNRISSACKGHEKGIPLRIDLVTMILCEHLPQQFSAFGQHIGVALAQLLQEARGALYIGEEQRDGSS